MKHTDFGDEEFLIRTYSKEELSLLYFPGMDVPTAIRTLTRWIKRNTALLAALLAIGYRPHCHSLTPREVALIVEYLGAPG